MTSEFELKFLFLALRRLVRFLIGKSIMRVAWLQFAFESHRSFTSPALFLFYIFWIIMSHMEHYLKYYDKFAFTYIFLKVFSTFLYRSVLEFLKFFGEFACNDYLILGSEIFFHIPESSDDSMNRFIDYHGIIFVLKRFEEGFTTLFDGQETEKPEVVHMHPRSDQRRENGGCSGNRNDNNLFFYGSFYEDVGGVRYTGSSRIRDKCYMLPFL